MLVVLFCLRHWLTARTPLHGRGHETLYTGIRCSYYILRFAQALPCGIADISSQLDHVRGALLREASGRMAGSCSARGQGPL